MKRWRNLVDVVIVGALDAVAALTTAGDAGVAYAVAAAAAAVDRSHLSKSRRSRWLRGLLLVYSRTTSWPCPPLLGLIHRSTWKASASFDTPTDQNRPILIKMPRERCLWAIELQTLEGRSGHPRREYAPWQHTYSPRMPRKYSSRSKYVRLQDFFEEANFL